MAGLHLGCGCAIRSAETFDGGQSHGFGACQVHAEQGYAHMADINYFGADVPGQLCADPKVHSQHIRNQLQQQTNPIANTVDRLLLPLVPLSAHFRIR